jgi:hypothetical protein
MKNLHIENSYNTWNPNKMKEAIDNKMKDANLEADPKKSMNRTYESMYVEWALHNVGYHVTKPFTKNSKMKHINERCKHVDLEER